MIVYSGISDLFVARSDGTEPRKLVSTNGTVKWPMWSPDGKSVRFVVAKEKPVPSSTLFEVPAEGGEPHEVTPYWKDKEFEFMGRWTPDGKYFLYLSGRDGRANIWAIRERQPFPWMRKRDPIQLTAGPVIYASLAPSPDGRKVFTRGVEIRGELQRYDSKSQQFKPFLQGLSADCCVCSRDGKWIAYVTFPERNLWRSRSDGSQPQQLTWPPINVLNPFWSPDGKQIAFTALVPGKTWKTLIIPSEGGEPRQLTQNECSELDAHWSPDGTHMIFAPMANAGNGEPSTSCPMTIYTLDLKTYEKSPIPGSEGLWSPRWSPDGKSVVAANTELNALMLYEIASRKWSELIRRSSGTIIGYPQWSGDGKLVYYGSMQPGHAVYSVRVKDHKVEKVADYSDIRSTTWLAVDPDGNPLIDRDIGLNEIYALDFEAP